MNRIVLSDDLVADAKSVVDKVIAPRDDYWNEFKIDGVKFFTSNMVKVALLKKHNVVIKFMTSLNIGTGSLTGDEIVINRLKHTYNAHVICKKFNLDLLYIPALATFQHQGRTIIVEEFIDVNANDWFQMEQFRLYKDSVSNALRQLYTFIRESSYGDVCARNNPIMDLDPECKGDRRIALIDLEDSCFGGLKYGGPNRCGLIGLIFNEELLVELFTDEVQVNAQKKRISEHLRCLEFYRTKNIVDGSEPLDEKCIETIPSVDFDKTGKFVKYNYKTEECFWETITIRDAMIGVIKHINSILQSDKVKDRSLIGKRDMCLSINHERFLTYHIDKIGIDIKELKRIDIRWMPFILEKFVEAGIIFQYKEENGHGYFIQV